MFIMGNEEEEEEEEEEEKEEEEEEEERSLTLIKSKYRNRLDVCDDRRLMLSSIHPNIEQLCKNRQAHPSH